MTLWDIMVHYNPERSAAQTPPPVCPKCGSHRTQVVGISDDGREIHVRCNACGERSVMPLDEPERMPVAG
jgi:uncharacterized Zn finger protein